MIFYLQKTLYDWYQLLKQLLLAVFFIQITVTYYKYKGDYTHATETTLTKLSQYLNKTLREAPQLAGMGDSSVTKLNLNQMPEVAQTNRC